MENILMNDPAQDCGNEQNSQFESTLAVAGTNIVVAYVDSNRGVFGLGSDPRLTSYIPRLVGYSVSLNGGLSFQDQDVPPLDAGGFGDGGDPVLAVDNVSNIVYLIGTSARQTPHAYKGVPFWKSTDGGVTFGGRTNIHEEIISSDKPWIAVDNGPGTGHHDVYVVARGNFNSTNGFIWLVTSTNGQGTDWSTPAVPIPQPGASFYNSAIIAVGTNHVAFIVWFESRTNAHFLKMLSVTDRGGSLSSVKTITNVVASDTQNFRLQLKRSNTSADSDYFTALPFPVVAINPSPSRSNHLYVAYADKPVSTNEPPDIFFVRSSNGGSTWTERERVNTVATNDQWMPVLTVKPDGSQLFMAWYDRRNDTNNGLIDVYGRFATIATNGSVTFSNEFRINTVSFPPVFAGTLASNKAEGHYDPVYAASRANLHWWYPEWPPPDPEDEALHLTPDTFINHVGEYNGVFTDQQFIYFTWTDYRNQSVGTLYPRNQPDIRMIRLTWP